MNTEIKAEVIRKLKAQNDEHQTAKAVLIELGIMELFENYWRKCEALNIPKTKMIQSWAATEVAQPFALLKGAKLNEQLAGIKFIMDAYQSACEQTAEMLLESD